MLNGVDQSTGLLLAGQRAGRGNKGIAEAERSRSAAGKRDRNSKAFMPPAAGS